MCARSRSTHASMCRRSKNATASRESSRFRCWSIWIGNGSRAGLEMPGSCYRQESIVPGASLVVLGTLSRRFLEIADALADAAPDFGQTICSENHDDDDQDD